MGFDVWGRTDVGLKRKSNEDSILINRDLGLFVVADGMGGHEGGEVASAIAVKTAEEIVGSYRLSRQKISAQNLIRECFNVATQRIYEKGHIENPELMGMGTTMVVGLEANGRLYVGNVGDSRAYLFSKNHLWQITEDHSLVNEQLRAGIITEEELETVSGKNVITRSVGFEKAVEVDIYQRDLVPGEIFLLCSDGLSGMVENEVLENILQSTPCSDVVEACIEAAKAGGGSDNISVIIAKAT